MKKKMFLQMFANPNTQTTLLSALSDENKTYYEKTLIDLAEPNLVHDQFGDKYPIPKNGGKTIEFRKFDSLPKALTPLTEGVTPDGSNLNVDKIEATVAQYGAYVTVSDILDLTAIDPVIVQSLKVLGAQAGKTSDTITRDVLAGGTNVMYGGTSGASDRDELTATDTLTPNNIFSAVATLQNMDAPTINGEYVGIIHPLVAYDLMTNPNWVDIHKYAEPSNIYNGEIGKIANVRFVMSTEAKCWKSLTDDCPADSAGAAMGVFSTLILGAGAYGVTELTGGGLQTIVKQKGSAGTADPLDQRSTVGWKLSKTAERLVEQYMIRIETVSSKNAQSAAN